MSMWASHTITIWHVSNAEAFALFYRLCMCDLTQNRDTAPLMKIRAPELNTYIHSFVLCFFDLTPTGECLFTALVCGLLTRSLHLCFRRDARTVNVLATVCLSPVTKVFCSNIYTYMYLHVCTCVNLLNHHTYFLTHVCGSRMNMCTIINDKL